MSGKSANGRSSIHRSSTGNGWEGWVTMGMNPVTGRTVRKHIRGATKAAVAAKVRQLEASRDAGYVVGGVEPTLVEWLATFIEMKRTSVAPKTLLGYTNDLRCHVANSSIGQIKLSKITPAHVEQLYREISLKGRSPGTVHHVRRTIGAALTVAENRGLIARNPVRAATVVRYKPKKAATVLSIDQVRRVLDVAIGRRNGARWAIGLCLGLRQGEAFGLQEGDVDLEAATLRIERQVYRLPYEHGCTDEALCLYATGRKRRAGDCPNRRGRGGLVIEDLKTAGSDRLIPLPPQLVEGLREHLRDLDDERRAAGSVWPAHEPRWLFPNRRGGPMEPSKDRKEWREILAEAGVRATRVHDARHTAATTMLLLNVNDRSVLDIFGWSSPAMLKRYQHPVDELRRKAADSVGIALFG